MKTLTFALGALKRFPEPVKHWLGTGKRADRARVFTGSGNARGRFPELVKHWLGTGKRAGAETGEFVGSGTVTGPMAGLMHGDCALSAYPDTRAARAGGHGARASGTGRLDETDVPRLTFSASEDAASLDRDWHALAAEGIGTAFQHPGWCRDWAMTRAAAADHCTLIITGRNSCGRLLFLLPLAQVKGADGWRIVSLNQYNNAYNGPLWSTELTTPLSAAALADLLGVVRAAAPKARRLCLEAQPLSWQGTCHPLSGLATARSAVENHVASLASDTDAVLAGLAKTVRRDLRKKLRFWADLPAATVIRHAEPTDRSDAIMRQLDFKSAQLAQAGKPSVFDDPALRRFYRTWARGPEALVYELHVDGAPIAGAFAAMAGQTCHLISVSMAPSARSHARRSPGLVVIWQVLTDAVAAGCTVLDLGPGDGQHKRIWRPAQIELFECHVALNRSGVLGAAVRNLRTVAMRRAKQSPRVRKAFDHWRRLRGR